MPWDKTFRVTWFLCPLWNQHSCQCHQAWHWCRWLSLDFVFARPFTRFADLRSWSKVIVGNTWKHNVIAGRSISQLSCRQAGTIGMSDSISAPEIPAETPPIQRGSAHVDYRSKYEVYRVYRVYRSKNLKYVRLFTLPTIDHPCLSTFWMSFKIVVTKTWKAPRLSGFKSYYPSQTVQFD